MSETMTLMRDIRSCPEVTALVGAEQLARLRTGAAFGPFRCWSCGKPGDASTEPAVLIAEQYDLAVRATLAHARCTDSRVVTISAAAPPGVTDTAAGADMAAIAGVMPHAAGHRPILVLEPRSEIFTLDASDRVDLMTADLLGRGWTLMRTPGQIPAHAPGWSIRLPAPGTLRLTGPGGDAMYDGECPWPPEWHALAAAAGACTVLAGSVGLYSHPGEVTIGQMARMLRLAARAGELAGALVTLT